MAEAQIQDAQPSNDIASLVGTDKGTVADLVKMQSAHTAEDFAITRKADRQADADQMRIERAYKAEGVGHDELKPWDADKEHKRFESDPIQGFGSVGGLFAMVASAFTKAPMENAINGMAGAINSIKAGDEAAYERAHQSWKDNTKLAVDRWKMQHDLYQDALSLMDHDATAANAKLRNSAVRFGDSQTLMLAEHGMVKELFELQAARAKSAEQMQEMADKTTLHDFQKAAVNAIKMNPPSTGDPVQDKLMLAAQVQRVFDGGGKYGTAEQEAVGRYVQANMKKNPQEFADGLAEIHQKFSPKAQNIEGYQQAKQAWHDAHPGETMPPDEDSKMLQQFGLFGTGRGAGGVASQSSQARKTRAIEEIMEKHKADGKPITMAEAEREFNKTVQIPSSHDVHQDDVQYAKAERMEGAMNEMDQLLLKHKFITGIGGSLSRPVEAIANILGSNETDRKQFQRVATELKEWGQSVVNDRTGRPLSTEARDAAVIFAGLNPGDTGPNTIRAITELRPVIKKIKADIFARGQGKGPVSGGGAQSEAPAGPAEPKGKDAPWLSDPVKP